MKKGWKRQILEVLEGVKRNKLLFLVLVLMQILFMVSVGLIGVSYQVKIYENVKGIIEPWEEMDYSGMEKSMAEESGPVMKEMMKKMVSITNSYKEMVRNIVEMVFLMLGSFWLFEGIGWSLANYLLKRGRWLAYWGKFILVSLVFGVPLSLISYGALKIVIIKEMDPAFFKMGLEAAGAGFLVAGYFMLIGFCLLDEKIKELFKKIFLIGIKKGHWVLLSLLIVLILGLLSLGLIYFSTGNIWVMAASWLWLVIMLVGGKLFLVKAISGLVRKGK